MNKRIRELHIQAQQEAFNEPIDIENCAVEDIKGFSQQVYEKFAELIVRECAKACEKNSYLALNGWQRAKQIREHFGVEE
jgi:hypothetical protein